MHNGVMECDVPSFSEVDSVLPRAVSKNRRKVGITTYLKRVRCSSSSDTSKTGVPAEVTLA